MRRISLPEFRRDAEAVIRQAQQGQRMILTYRGKPVLRLEPIREQAAASDDPFYSLGRLASRDADALTNEEIDKVIYEP